MVGDWVVSLEGRAVLVVSRFDAGEPGFVAALEVALGRRGSRDALLVLMARERSWGAAVPVLSGVSCGGGDAEVNRLAVLGAALWCSGEPAEALGVLSGVPEDHVLRLMMSRFIERGVPGSVWAEQVAKQDVGRCFGFAG